MLAIPFMKAHVYTHDRLKYGQYTIKHLLNHCRAVRTHYILSGYGSGKGLYSCKNDKKYDSDRIVVGNLHAYYLRKHGGNVIVM